MQRRDVNLTAAVCVSLILHVGLLIYSAHRYVRDSRVYLAPAWRREQSIVLNLQAPDLGVHDELGTSTGTGTGSNASEGDRPLQAPQADQDQAFLSRDPSGPGKVGSPPTRYNGPLGEGGIGGQTGASAIQPPAHIDEPAAPPAVPPTAGNLPAPPLPTPTPAPASDSTPPPPKNEVASNPPSPAPPTIEVSGKGSGEKPLPSDPPGTEFAIASTDLKPDALEAGQSKIQVPDVRRADAVELSSPVAPPPRQTELGHEVPRNLPAGPSQPITVASTAVALSSPVEPLKLSPPKAPAPLDPAHAPKPPAPHSDTAAAPAMRPATGDGHAPGRPASADPAPLSDTESDAFSKVGSAVFHNGKLAVRQGRKVKTTRPQILVPGLLDEIGLANPTVVLRIDIDPTGKVTNVDVFRSSGSNDLDQPCLRAVYDWWFEPARDAHGKPTSDSVLFAITFR